MYHIQVDDLSGYCCARKVSDLLRRSDRGLESRILSNIWRVASYEAILFSLFRKRNFGGKYEVQIDPKERFAN